MDQNQNKGLKTNTVILMIGTALFFDALQSLLSFILMGWMVDIFATMTFYLWFKIHGIKFSRGRSTTFVVGAIIDLLPIPLLAWTATISYLALKEKVQEVVPGADIVKLDIMNR